MPLLPEGVAVSKTGAGRLEARGAFEAHGPAGEELGLLYLGLGEAEVPQEAEAGKGVGRLGQADGLEGFGSDHEGGEGCLERDRVLERALDLAEGGPGQPLRPEGLEGQPARSTLQRPVAQGVGLDLPDRGLGMAQGPQGGGHGLVDDLEVPASRQLLELHEGEVGLDPRGVAIHEEADRAGRGYRAHLGVAVAVAFAQGQGLVPGICARRPRGSPGRPRRPTGGRHGQSLVLGCGGAVGRAAVIPDDAEHVRPVGVVARGRAPSSRTCGPTGA